MALMREDRRSHEGNAVRAYEVQKIKVLDEETPNTSNGVGSHPQSKIGSSYPVAKIIKKVEKAYENGKNILDESEKAEKKVVETGRK